MSVATRLVEKLFYATLVSYLLSSVWSSFQPDDRTEGWLLLSVSATAVLLSSWLTRRRVVIAATFLGCLVLIFVRAFLHADSTPVHAIGTGLGIGATLGMLLRQSPSASFGPIVWAWVRTGELQRFLLFAIGTVVLALVAFGLRLRHGYVVIAVIAAAAVPLALETCSRGLMGTSRRRG